MTVVHQIRVPYAGEWLTSNKEKFRYTRAKWVRAWREATLQACRATKPKLPTRITPVTIHAIAYYTGHAPVKDRPNLYPTIKAIIDGLTPMRVITRRTADGTQRRYTTLGYGLLPDDTDQHIHNTTWELRPLPPKAQPYVQLIITHQQPGADQ